jgi:hypothetical protein
MALNTRGTEKKPSSPCPSSGFPNENISSPPFIERIEELKYNRKIIKY